MKAFAIVLLAVVATKADSDAEADAYTFGQIGYGGYGGHYYGKREAEADSEAEPEAVADADAYTFGQIAYGLPQHNAYATGHPHNVGVITGVDYGHGRVSGYGAIGNRGYYGGYSAGHIGYSGNGGHFYGKREADSDADAYTLGQIAYGLPQHNAYATGHPHNVGVITGLDYGHGRVSGYGAIS